MRQAHSRATRGRATFCSHYFGVPFLLGGLLPIGIGLAVMMGHTEVVLTNGRLRTIEKVNLLPVWSWSRPVESLKRLEVVWGNAKIN